ncbi:MAG TPA: hypothetical protein VM261_06855 [Kofleriaceae bacterium]|nr:hypothetical protein [Kofleriaceae bacterium]
MKLGEMLLRDGRITPAQLEEAIAFQAKSGGRFGTVLFELGFIDLDALTVYLGLELGIPIASGAMLERAKRAAVRLLTPEQAYKFKCVPLIVQDRQLIAAVDEPHDLVTMDALARLTGYRIIPRVAAEVRIFYYVERYYGVPRPSRFLRFGDTPRGHQPPTDALPAPPLPGLPPMALKPIAAPRPAPALRFGRAPSPPPPEEELSEPYDAIALEASDMLEEITTDGASTAAPSPMDVMPSGPVGAPRTSEIHDAIQMWEPLDANATLAAIDAAPDRAAVTDALMQHAAQLFDVAVLFIARDNLAFGWKAHGEKVDAARIECVVLPLDAPSIFQQAVVSERGLYHGPPTPSALLQHWFKVLRCREPSDSTVATIAIRKRVVNLVYGHRTGDRPPPSELELDDLRRIADAAANAYVRVITGAKKA